MKKISNNATAGIIGFALVALFAFLVLASPANATAAEVCPEEGKVESIVDGDIDGIILDEGTLVCIKGGQTLVNVVADGSSTLAALLGTGQNVSHYTVLELPTTTTTSSTTTTTTSIPETTTTTVKETTTTTEEGTTTTHGEESTTTTNPQETTTSAPSGTTTPEAPTTTGNETTGETLPYTGVGELGTLSAIGLVLLGLGALLLTFLRGNQE